MLVGANQSAPCYSIPRVSRFHSSSLIEDNDVDEEEDDASLGGGGGGGFASPSARRRTRFSFLRSCRRFSASVLISTASPRSDVTDLLFSVCSARRALFAVFSR